MKNLVLFTFAVSIAACIIFIPMAHFTNKIEVVVNNGEIVKFQKKQK